MNIGGSVYSRDYDWAAELRVRIPPLIKRLRTCLETSASERVAVRIMPYLQRFLDEASKPVPDRNALAGKLVRDFNRNLSCERDVIADECREDLIDIINIVYMQPTAILYTPPGEKQEADAHAAEQIAWQGSAVAFSPTRRFQWPFLTAARAHDRDS